MGKHVLLTVTTESHLSDEVETVVKDEVDPIDCRRLLAIEDCVDFFVHRQTQVKILLVDPLRVPGVHRRHQLAQRNARGFPLADDLQ